jgi:hypothetical protein
MRFHKCTLPEDGGTFNVQHSTPNIDTNERFSLSLPPAAAARSVFARITLTVGEITSLFVTFEILARGNPCFTAVLSGPCQHVRQLNRFRKPEMQP